MKTAILMANLMAAIAPARFRAIAAKRFVRPRVRQQTDTGRDFLATLDAGWIEGPLGRQRIYSGGQGPAIFFLHGWEADAADLSSHAQHLMENGYRVVLIDGPAHGASDGHKATLPLFAEGLGAAAATFGQPFAIVAHSMGAASSVVAMSEGLVKPAAFVALASPCSLAGNIAFQAGAMGLSKRAIALMQGGVEHVLKTPIARFDIAQDAPSMTAKALFIYGDNDTIVPVSAGESAAKDWPGARLVIKPGLGHRGVLRDPGVLAEVADFLDSVRP
ncbi:alpha/beta hydrolase [Synechococcus moorigangaii CMS01]|nr:alpha/beta hydrolase [Synechococcus moorigangaii CMS01]